MRKKTLHRGYRIAAYIMPLYIAAFVELTAFGTTSAYAQMFTSARIANLLFTVALLGCAYFGVALLTRHYGVAAILTYGLPAAMTFVSYQKLMTLGSPFVASDFLLAGRAGDIKGFAGTLSIPTTFYVTAAVLLLLTALLFFGRPRRRRVPGTLFCASIYAVAALAPFTILAPSAANNVVLMYQRGYVSSFVSDVVRMRQNDNMLDTLSAAIEGENGVVNIDEIMRQTYTPPVAPEDVMIKPDVIVILSEAFWDPMNLGSIQVTPDPTTHFQRLRDEGVSFNMIAPVFGGNTVVSEFEVLSGLTLRDLAYTSPYEQYINVPDHQPVPTLASYFKELGYATKALHTFEKSFYGREEAYKLFGFDTFIGMEDFPTYDRSNKKMMYVGDYTDLSMVPPLPSRDGRYNYITDESFTDRLLWELKRDTDPTFYFGITMGNHGLYLDKFTEFDVTVTSSILNDEQRNKVSNLAEGVYHADLQLARLCDALAERDRPTVLLFFGDHLPSMGPGYDTFIDSGFVENIEIEFTDDEWLRMHTTPAFIWSNYDTTSYDAGTVSPCFMGNMLLDYIGLPKTDFYSFLDLYRAALPVVSERVTIDADGNRVTDLSKEQRLLTSSHLYISRGRILKPDEDKATDQTDP